MSVPAQTAWQNGRGGAKLSLGARTVFDFRQIPTGSVGPSHEAHTSLYVYHVLRDCLRWPMGKIQPQAVMRGFIDYELAFPHSTVCLHVEVKKFGSPLKDTQIRKYLVQRGPRTEELRVGVLTNLIEWRVYVAGSGVRGASGTHMVLVKAVTIRRRSDIEGLHALIGYRSNGRLKNVRAALAESPAVLRHLISNDEQVLKAVRRKLADLQDRHRIDARVPQNDSLRKWISKVLNSNSARFSSWSPAKLKQALRSRPVVEVTNRRLQALCGSRSRHNKLRRAINQILKECSETRLGKAA